MKNRLKKYQKGFRKKLFNEDRFRNFVEESANSDLISEQQKQEVLRSLEKAEAKELIRLAVRLQLFSIGLFSLQSVLTGGVLVKSKNVLTGVKSYLLFDIINSISKYIFIRQQGAQIPGIKKIALMGAVPYVGNTAVWLSIFKKYPEFTKMLFAYNGTRRIRRKKRKLSPGTPEYKEKEAEEYVKFLKSYNRIENVYKFIQNVSSRVKHVLKIKQNKPSNPLNSEATRSSAVLT